MSAAPGALPDFDTILTAKQSVSARLPRTPLHSYPGLCRVLDADVRVKHENHHVLGAFKVRGGVHLASRLGDAERRGGLFTASTGNHGQSIAFAGRIADVPVTVGVPRGANPQKVRAMRDLGARVLERGPDFDSAREWAAEEAGRRGGRFVAPTEPELIAGVASLYLEILEDCPEAEAVIVPIGSGSSACAACLVRNARKPDLAVYGVQSESAPAAWRSWSEGRLVAAAMESRAEGVATRVAYANTQAVLRDPELGLRDFVLVSDAAMEEAVRDLLRHAHTLSEHAGAAPLAAGRLLADRLRGRTVVLVLSGGNLSFESLGRIVAAGNVRA
ncbi:MAG: threonine ammonia-lyase [Myxococcota bacterium]